MKKKLYKYKVDQERQYELDSTYLTYRLPDRVLAWLHRYGITDYEIQTHNFSYDTEKSSLVMPVMDGDRIVFVSTRYFGDNPDHPKYINKGYKTGFFKLIPNKDSNVFILTEDYISAIKVGRFVNTIPLFGTYCPRELIYSLLPHSPKLRFWLDFDKASEAAQQAARARQWILDCATIVTEKDPKDYSDEKIKSIINDSILQPT